MTNVRLLLTAVAAIALTSAGQASAQTPNRKQIEAIVASQHDANVKALQDWIKVRGMKPGPLFISFDRAQKGDGRLDGSSLWRVVQKYGLGHTHGLRHLAITEYAKTEKDVIKVMKFGRHKDPKTTMTYIDNLKETTSEASEKLAQIRENRAKETGNGQ